MARLSTLTLLGAAALTVAHPLQLTSRQAKTFPAGSSWDIVLMGSGSPSTVNAIIAGNFETIDIDLFDTPTESIARMKANKKVICYFSAGSYEDWRDDAIDFNPEDYRNPVEDGPGGEPWEGERWVDVTSTNVRDIMSKRIQLASEKGCDAVDPDNTDGFANDTGFDHPREAYVDYVKFMAQVAKENNLAIGLKNSLAMIPDVVDDMDFAVNEQCHEFGECDEYRLFTAQDKAVFNIEYGNRAENPCADFEGIDLSTLVKDGDFELDDLGGAC